FGTGLLDWPWLTFPPLVTLTAGACLCWRRFPGPYATAQLLDTRLHLADALSTAFFFTSPQARRCDAGMRAAQIGMASRLAAGIDLRTAVPFRMPRAVYWSLALACVSAGLLALRYRFEGRIDLRLPATPAIAQFLQDARTEIAAMRRFFE